MIRGIGRGLWPPSPADASRVEAEWLARAQHGTDRRGVPLGSTVSSRNAIVVQPLGDGSKRHASAAHAPDSSPCRTSGSVRGRPSLTPCAFFTASAALVRSRIR